MNIMYKHSMNNTKLAKPKPLYKEVMLIYFVANVVILNHLCVLHEM